MIVEKSHHRHAALDRGANAAARPHIWALIIVIAAVLLVFAIYPARASQVVDRSCDPNEVMADGRPGVLAITDFAISYKKQSCPTSALTNSEPIALRVGQRLYLWLRLQGDLDYLAKDSSRRELGLAFYFVDGRNRTFEKSIGMGHIARASVSAEAHDGNGSFDWRVFAWRTSLLIPGDYEAWVEQGGEKVCLLGGSGDCGIKFRVMP